MASIRSDQWETDTDGFTEEHIEAILSYCGIDIESETASHFLVMCPYHSNRDTAAMEVNKTLGIWCCFNPMCEAKGNIRMLIGHMTDLKPLQIERLINRLEKESVPSLADRLTQTLAKKYDFQQFSPDTLANLKYEFWKTPRAMDYMQSRGFEIDTLEHFDVGYSVRRDLITVPVHAPNGMAIGLVGRSPGGKIFKNSFKLPKSKTIFNLHRAKRVGQTIIVVEASFDTMKVHQAGYPNVGALLGGFISHRQVQLLQQHFNKIIIMTDLGDEIKIYANCGRCKDKCVGHSPGRLLGESIADKLKNKKIAWAQYSDNQVFPEGKKDPAAMTDDEIRQCVKNQVSNFELRNASMYATI